MNDVDWLRSLKIGMGIDTADDRQRVMRIADSLERLSTTFKRIYAEQMPNTWFVCGECGDTNRHGLPAGIIVCPAYGSDVTEIYRRFDAPNESALAEIQRLGQEFDASGMEARRAETAKTGSVHDSPTAESGDAQ